MHPFGPDQKGNDTTIQHSLKRSRGYRGDHDSPRDEHLHGAEGRLPENEKIGN